MGRLKTLGSAIPVLGAATRFEQNRRVDRERGSAAQRGYGARWRRYRTSFIARHPLCFYCEHGVFGPARVVPTDLVDHVEPHRGDQGLFWDPANHAASCTTCHAGPKQALEARGPEAIAAWIATLPPRPA